MSSISPEEEKKKQQQVAAAATAVAADEQKNHKDAQQPGPTAGEHPQEEADEDFEAERQRVIHAELGEMTELESLCPKCEENGTTRLMITDVPFFKKIIVSSFACEHCGERNTEIQFGGEFGPKRTRHHLHVKCKEDMARQVVKSEHASLRIPELELEIPRETQRGSLNTVEGVLVHTIEGLQFEQPVRKVTQPEFAEKIDEFCQKLESYREGTIGFSLILDDPAGNSFIEPRYDYYHPTIDPQLQMFAFTRTPEERMQLGLPIHDDEMATIAAAQNAKREGSGDAASAGGKKDNDDDGGDDQHQDTAKRRAAAVVQQQQRKQREGIGASMYNSLRSAAEEKVVDDGEITDVFEMKDNCPACHRESTIRMHPCNIPYFRETIIMSFKCESCGYKSTEVQTGGAIPAKGKKVSLRIENEADMKRDVLKSNTASMSVPELELELVAGTLGGFFTTIEGLLTQVYDNLSNTPRTDFTSYGDGAAAEKKATLEANPNHDTELKGSMDKWLQRLKEATQCKVLPLTVILDDPLGSVYVQNPRAHLPPPDNVDPQLTEEEYTRTFEQDEDLGLHDMDC